MSTTTATLDSEVTPLVYRSFESVPLEVWSRKTGSDGKKTRLDFILGDDKAPKIILFSINGRDNLARITWNGHEQDRPIVDGQVIIIYQNSFPDGNHVIHFCRLPA